MPRGKHQNHTRGTAHPRATRLGVALGSNGYVKVRVGISHPMADANGWAYLHRLVASAALGRPLDADEIVHHSNGDKTDNRWANLEVTSRADHNRLHNQERGRDELGRFSAAGRVLDGRTWDEMPNG